jgi:hypothetical protein
VREHDWSEVEVFVDRLRAAGDPRAELLAFELAAERATSSEDARRLNREAQRIRDLHRALVWPSVLADTEVDMRAGFVVSANYDEIAGPSIPLELVLSVRDLSISRHRRPEDCAPLLDRARARGLQLDGLHQSHSESGPAIDLARLRNIDTLERLSLAGAVTGTEALAKFGKLVSCSFGAPLQQAQLCSLAPLKLEHLRLHGQAVDPVIVPLFGHTLTVLELRAWSGSLAPLQGLPWLRKLIIDHPMPPGAIAQLDGMLRLEELAIPTLDEAGLSVLSRLPLRRLAVGRLSARLATGLARLRTLESLVIHSVDDGPFDLSPLAELSQLRRLVVDGELVGALTLRPGFEWLAIGARRPVSITGEVPELAIIDADVRSLPSSLLAQVRTLRLVWLRTRPNDALDELPRLLPRLERLDLANYQDREWAWPEAPEVLDRMPRLRGFEMVGVTTHELAEIARAFPELCPLTGAWPRSCGEHERTQATTRGSAPREPLEHGEFAPLRAWASALRADKDMRGELLELELAAELTDDDAEARARNAEALELRLRHPQIAWPLPMRRDHVLLRGGMAVCSSAGWVDRFVPPLELMMQLRQVEIDTSRSVDACVASLARASAVGMRLDRLRIDGSAGDSLWRTEFERLADSGITQLELRAQLRAEQLQRLPLLPLRHLGSSADNFDPRWIQRYASTLESLTLYDTNMPTGLAGLALPRLERLDVGYGWTDSGALVRPGLRWLSVSCDDTNQLESLLQLGPRQLRLNASASSIVRLPRTISGLSHLELQCWFPGPHDDVPPLMLARMFNLRSFSLRLQRYSRAPEQLTVELPETVTTLSLPPMDTRFVIRGGSIDTLACRSDAVSQLPGELCAGVRRLTLHDTELTRELIERLPRLESMLPRLRTLVLPSFSLERIPELSVLLPRVQLHPVDPGHRDLELWPRPR